MPDHQFVLTLSCPDRPGIVSAVSTFLAHNGQNILDAQQFNDIETQKFFMRVVFTAAGLLAIVVAPSRLIADRAYDANKLRDWLSQRGADAVIPPNPTRKHPHAWDADAYKSACSAGSKTTAASLPDTTSSPATSSPAPSLPQP